MAWVADAKFAGNMSAWATRAGLSRSMLSTFGTRWAAHKAGVGEAPSLKADTLAKLAEVAGVSFEWLSTGRGEPGELGAPSNPCPLADLYRKRAELTRQLAVLTRRLAEVDDALADEHERTHRGR